MDSIDIAQEAVKSRGYEAGLLVILVVGMLGAGGWILRSILADARSRETYWNQRLTELENRLHEGLTTLVSDATKAMVSMTESSNRIEHHLERLSHALAQCERNTHHKPPDPK